MKKIGLASDHAGFELKEYVKTWLKAKNYPFEDFGTYSTDSCDYPDFAHPAGTGSRSRRMLSGYCYLW